MGGNSITTPEESHLAVAGDGKRAAKLASSTALGIFAAGNIFAGRFIKAVVFPNMGGELTMGVPYSSRPLRLKGYYDYSPGTIDKTKSPYTDLNGTIDRCHIYVVLAERNDPFEISTADKKFIDFENDPSIIAFGELVSDVKTNGYREFSIDLTYRDDRKPTMVAIVASASRYGDYFTGSTKSVLYIDEFEFDFEAN